MFNPLSRIQNIKSIKPYRFWVSTLIYSCLAILRHIYIFVSDVPRYSLMAAIASERSGSNSAMLVTSITRYLTWFPLMVHVIVLVKVHLTGIFYGIGTRKNREQLWIWLFESDRCKSDVAIIDSRLHGYDLWSIWLAVHVPRNIRA